MKIRTIEFLSDIKESNSENDSIDVHVVLEDGRAFTLVVATPNNIFWCMENEGKDYFFGEPMVFVKQLTKRNVKKAVRAIVAEGNGRWLKVYG